MSAYLYIDGVIKIADQFWPYQRICDSVPVTDLAGYIGGKSRFLFLQRRLSASGVCLQPPVNSLLPKLHRMGVPIIDVEQAILLNCLRKYASVLNNGGGTPIHQPALLSGMLLNEAGEDISPDYWSYTSPGTIRMFEQRWNGFGNRPAGETK